MKVKIRYYVRTEDGSGTFTDTIEIDADVWLEMTPEEREDYMRELAWNSVEWGWDEVTK